MISDVMYDVWLLQLIYLPPPWGDCKVTAMDSDFFESYSITACRIDCETRYLVDNCNCRMVHMPGKGNSSSCVLYHIHVNDAAVKHYLMHFKES